MLNKGDHSRQRGWRSSQGPTLGRNIQSSVGSMDFLLRTMGSSQSS